jgi:hypothetical protein
MRERDTVREIYRKESEMGDAEINIVCVAS